jgi:hypothetical protein
MESPYRIGFIVILSTSLLILIPSVHGIYDLMETKTIIDEEGPAQGTPPTEYEYTATFTILENMTVLNVTLKEVWFDDTGTLLFNDGGGIFTDRDYNECDFTEIDNPQTDITGWTRPGINYLEAIVTDNCGGRQGVRVVIEIYYLSNPWLAAPHVSPPHHPSVSVAEIPYVGPRLGVSGSTLQVPTAPEGFNLTVHNYGESASNDSFVRVEITGNYTDTYDIPQNFSLGPGGSTEVLINLSVPDGKHNLSVFFTSIDPETNASFTSTANATLIVGNYSAPNVNVSQQETLVTYQTQDILRAYTYLSTHQNPDGGWGENGSSILTTAIIVDALDGHAPTWTLESGWDYLESRLDAAEENFDLTARALLPLLRANRSSPAIDDAVLRLKGNATEEMGWGHTVGFEADPLASLSVGRVFGNGTWLLEEKPSGSWRVFSQDDVFTTARVLSVLAGKTSTDEVVTYLEGQDTNTLSVAEKAAVLEALTRVKKTSYTEQLAQDLFSDQEADGGFGDVASTAYAVQALQFYELTVVKPYGELYTVMPSPLFSPGETFSTTVVVFNTGDDLLVDDLWVTLKDPSGAVVYRDWSLLDIRPGDAEILDIEWAIPGNATSGTYTFTAEFYETESYPEVRFFEVSG